MYQRKCLIIYYTAPLRHVISLFVAKAQMRTHKTHKKVTKQEQTFARR